MSEQTTDGRRQTEPTHTCTKVPVCMPESPPEEGTKIEEMAAVMLRFYLRWHGPGWAATFDSRRRDVVDVRHLVRWRIHQRFEAGPTAVAAAEGLIAGTAPHHSTIIHSLEVAETSLAAFRAPLLASVDQIFNDIGVDMVDSNL